LQAREIAVHIGHDAEQGWPALAGAAILGAVVAGGVKAQGWQIKIGGDGAAA
jgi:hypothetical protein